MAHRWGGRAAWAAALGGGLIAGALLVGPGLLAGDQPGASAKAALPSDLKQVPPDAVAFFTIRVADAWNHDAAKDVRQRLVKDGHDVVQDLAGVIGLGPDAVERLTLVMTEVNAQQPPLMIVSPAKPVDRMKVVAAAVRGANEEKYKGQTLYVGPQGPAVLFVDDRAYLVGTPEALKATLDRPAPKGEGGLDPALQLAAEKHLVVVGVNPAGVNQEVGSLLPAEAEPFKPLLAARAASLTADLGDKADAVLRVTFADEAAAKQGEKAVRAGLEMGRTGIGALAQSLAGQPDDAKLAEALKQTEAGLKAATVQQKGNAVQAAVSVKADLKVVAGTLVEAVQKVREAAQRARSANSLKQLGLAMHNYHDKEGSFPPAAVFDKNGKALLSWRVLLLPYLEADDLYKEFKLDEPWDSAHNKKLLAKMPPLFASPTAKPEATDTIYQAFVGDGTVFEGKKGIPITDIKDGTSNTIMIVEAADAVPWTKPADLPYDPAKPLPKLGGVSKAGANALFCDGSVRFLAATIAEQTLRALITRSGGETICSEP